MVASVTSAYLAIGQSYFVLRAWKNHANPRLARRLLRPDILHFPNLRPGEPAVLIPIGQTVSRSWQLGRNPALEVALALRQKSGVQIQEILSAPQRTDRAQTKELGREARYASALAFSLLRPLAHPTCVLVDDLRTTGRTLRAAGAALQAAGAQRIHYYSLAYRPPGLDSRRTQN